VTEAAVAHPIVVGYDDSTQSRDALAFAVALAGATADPIMLAGAFGSESRRQQVLERLVQVTDSLPQNAVFGLECRTAPGPSPAAALHELAEDEQARALVLGSPHRGPLGRVLIGSVAESVLRGSPCPVVIVPLGLAEQAPVQLRTICVAFDGRPEAWTALQRGAQIAEAAQARLRIVMAVPTDEPNRQAAIELGHASESVTRALDSETELLHGDAADVLAAQRKHGIDLLVTGSRGFGPVRRVLLGSVSTALMRSAPFPVMVVPRTARFEPDAAGLAGEDEVVPRA
jgi:nucleotide-binding universal stress UspA family protein